MRHLFFRRIGAVLGGAVALTALDQWVKQLVVTSLSLGVPRDLIPPVLALNYHRNTGAAFSLLRDAPVGLLVGMNLLVLVGFLLLIRPHLQTRVGQVAAAAIIGGGVGNLIDRARLHYVVDYLDFHIRPHFQWAVFNLADVFVVVGVALLMWQIARVEFARSPRPVPAITERDTA